MILFNQAYATNFSWLQCPLKFKPKFIQQTSQITNIAKTSQFQCSQNPSQNSSNKHHKLPTLPKLHNFYAPIIQAKNHPTTSQITNIAEIPQATNIVHITPWPKDTTFQKCSKANITTWSIIQCPKFQQDHTTQWQCLNIKFSIPNLKFSTPRPNFHIPNFQSQIFKPQIF